jgi:hypothetical protein
LEFLDVCTVRSQLFLIKSRCIALITSVLSRSPGPGTAPAPQAAPKLHAATEKRAAAGHGSAQLSQHVATQRIAALCIYNLTCDAACIDEAAAGGLARIVAMQIKPPETSPDLDAFLLRMDKNVQHSAVEAACNLAAGSPATVQKLLSVGLLAPMLTIMSHCSRAETVHICLMFLVRLSCNRSCITRLVGDGALPAVSKVSGASPPSGS